MPIHLTQFSYQDPAWHDCCMIREAVFIQEQAVPLALEWDAQDATAIHLLASTDGQAIACARVLPDGHIGRMAVLPAWRGRGVGAVVLQAAIQICRDLTLPRAQLSAQTHAVDFYARVGFVVVSAPYLDANIPHVDMVLELL